MNARRLGVILAAVIALTAACTRSGDDDDGGADAAAPLTLIALGDSLSHPVGTGADDDWLRWADPDGRFELIGNAGVPGDRTDQIFARIERDVIAKHPAWVTVLAGTNDISQDVRAELIIVNLAQIYDALEAAGISFVAITVPPLVMMTPERVAAHQAVNAWLRERVEIDWPGSVLGDWSAAVSVNGDSISPAPGFFRDGVHFSAAGAQAAGTALAPVLATIADAAQRPSSATGSIGSAGTNPSTSP